MTDETLLREPASRAVRIVALSLLDDVRAASDRLREAAPAKDDAHDDDGEALHDLRVAIRRLRSWLRSCEPWLADALSRKHTRRLKAIASATGPARDTAVHLAWLLEQRHGAGMRQRAGINWMIERLEARHTDEMDKARSATRDADALCEKLERRLNMYCVPIRAGAASEDEPFGVALADLVRHESEVLCHRLAAVQALSDHAEAHRARISAKRLRYLLEPTARPVDDGETIIAELRDLQDALGDLHDAHVFSEEIAVAAEEAAAARARRLARAIIDDESGAAAVRRAHADDPAAGLLRLAHRLHDRAATAFAMVERDWLGDASAPFFARVRALADALASCAASRAIEIEADRVPDKPRTRYLHDSTSVRPTEHGSPLPNLQ
jgi:CHAD domain-containing protein